MSADRPSPRFGPAVPILRMFDVDVLGRELTLIDPASNRLRLLERRSG